MNNKAKNILKYALLVLGLIFIILCIIAFIVLLTSNNESEDLPARVMTSLEEIQNIKEKSELVEDFEGNMQGEIRNIIDENKIEIGGEYEGEINTTDYEPGYVYVSENTRYINLANGEELKKEDIKKGDILIAEGKVYKNTLSSYYKYCVDALNETVKILKTADYGKMRNDYFLNKKEIENVRMVSNRIPKRVSLAYDKEINGEIVPLVQIFETNGNAIKEVVRNSILNVTLEKPLEVNDEKNLGVIVDFKVKD